MNKSLIKKYKPEFEHWLAGGTILYKHKNSLAWRTTDCWDYEIEYVQAIIINDKYVEFRKALAEGKIVQYNFGNYGINRKDFPNTWKDLDTSVGILADRAYPDNYRIKPEEPQFKVGDWVINTKPPHNFGKEPSAPFCITQDWLDHIKEHGKTIQGNTRITGDLENFIPWQPKPGEWCWFFDKNKDKGKTNIVLAKFISIYTSASSVYYKTSHLIDSGLFELCEPFIGELPNHLKVQ